MHSVTAPRTIAWVGGIDGFIRLIDQTLLPTRLEYRDCRTVEDVWEAIRNLRVRGAPAIGVAAAMGVVLSVADYSGDDPDEYFGLLRSDTDPIRNFETPYETDRPVSAQPRSAFECCGYSFRMSGIASASELRTR